MDSSFSDDNNKRARLAQSVEHQTFNLRVMGSDFDFLIIQLSGKVDLHLSKALFSLDADNLQLHCFLKGLENCSAVRFLVLSTNHVRR